LWWRLSFPVVLAEAVLDAVPLRVDDAIEALGDIVEYGAEIVAVEVPRSSIAEAIEQVLQSHHSAAAGELGSVLHHAPQRAPQTAVVEHLVSDMLHDVLCRE
jgi:hypothetical protein